MPVLKARPARAFCILTEQSLDPPTEILMEIIYSALGYLAAIAIWVNANYTLAITYSYSETADRPVWNLRFASRDTRPEHSLTSSNSHADR